MMRYQQIGRYGSACVSAVKSHKILSFFLGLPVFFLALGPALAHRIPATHFAGSLLNACLLSSVHWSFLLWVGAGGVLFFRFKRRWFGLGLSAAGLFGLGSPFAPAGTGLLIVSANVQAYAENAEALEARLSDEMADVVLTVERRAEQLRGMVRVGDNYSTNLAKPSHGLAYFCREGLDCEAWVSPPIGEGTCGMPIGLLRLQSKTCVVGVHVPPPVPGCAEGIQPYVQWMTDRIASGRISRDEGPCHQGDPVLVMGDFNAPPGSRITHKMLNQGLRDAQAGRGIYASTWPAGGGWPNFPVFRLDHVFEGALEVTGVQQFSLPQSDHQALRIWIQVD
jgi:endonuclease/exonuclease/phosphatase (EEP) superfamily protein YafD